MDCEGENRESTQLFNQSNNQSSVFHVVSIYSVQPAGVATQVLTSQSPNDLKQQSQYQQVNKLFQYERNFPWDLSHFPDVLFISQIHDPYKLDIAGKGNEQVFQ